MPRVFENGQIPESWLVYDKYGNPWIPGTYNKWVKFQRYVYDEKGVWLYVTPKGHGAYNTYRDYQGQKSLKLYWTIKGAPNMASDAGYSSHGGLWTGRVSVFAQQRYKMPFVVYKMQSGAFDVANWYSVPWEVFQRCAERAGLRVNVTVPEERWHVVDPEPTWDKSGNGGTPAGDASGESDEPIVITPEEMKEYNMQIIALPGKAKTDSEGTQKKGGYYAVIGDEAVRLGPTDSEKDVVVSETTGIIYINSQAATRNLLKILTIVAD